jgi:hypothetical protein
MVTGCGKIQSVCLLALGLLCPHFDSFWDNSSVYCWAVGYSAVCILTSFWNISLSILIDGGVIQPFSIIVGCGIFQPL